MLVFIMNTCKVKIKISSDNRFIGFLKNGSTRKKTHYHFCRQPALKFDGSISIEKATNHPSRRFFTPRFCFLFVLAR